MKKTLMLLALALSTDTAFSSTILLTSDPGTGTTTTFAFGSGHTSSAGPVSLDGFSVTGDPTVAYGNSVYSLTSNGSWDQSLIGTNDSDGSVTVNLEGDYSLVGALLNYAPGSGSDATITALGSDGVTVIGTYDLATLAPISTPGEANAEAFRGIESTSADIAYLEISGDFIVAHSIEVGGEAPASVTPEPPSLLLMGTGLLGAVGMARRKLVARSLQWRTQPNRRKGAW